MRALAAPGLSLEPQTAAHAEAMFAVLSDPAIYRFENQPPPSLVWLRARFARLKSRRSPDGRERWLNWMIRCESGELAGYVQATVRRDGSAAIAYVLGSAFWGRGLGRRATAAMIAELVAAHRVLRLEAVVLAANHRSIRLLRSLGFTAVPAGREGQDRLLRGEFLFERTMDRGGGWLRRTGDGGGPQANAGPAGRPAAG
jgi:ribosomal-protein-alanine N-acetyltransferase